MPREVITGPTTAGDIMTEPVSDLRQRLLHAGRGTALLTIATMAASFVSQIWLAREFGPAGLGEYAATSLFIIFIATLGSAGLPLATSQAIASYEERIKSDGRADPLGAAVTLAVVAAVFAGVVGSVSWVAFARL